MSFTVLVLAALHGVPIFLAAALTRNKAITTVVAVIMAVIAVVVGRAAYNVIDLAAVVVTLVACLAML